MKINPNLSVLENDNELVILRIGSNGGFIKMSAIEYDIINYYSKTPDFYIVQEYFRNDVLIIKEQMDLLIKKAYESKIFINDDSKIEKGGFINFILKRNKKMFEVLNFDFTNNVLERIFENRFFSNGLIAILITFFSYILYNLFSEPLNFKENYLATLYQIPVSFSSIFGFIYLAAIISTLIHEFGHYFIYKRLGGKTSVFGFGLLFFFIPVFFNKVLIGLIKKSKDRIYINSGGILFDFLQVIFLVYFTKVYHQNFPIISFFCYSLMISIFIRTFFNINIFLPGSDGYFIFTDLIKKPNLFESSWKKTKNIFLRKEQIGYKNFICALYIGICYLSFAISWCMVLLPILTYLYYASIK
ncbi:hypothetical protein ACUN24_09080 [Pedobacter sp. WC2501]|uniref:hypothetical protein n=1 Tax=Pedobacter sp. WC2501 TaxID=3461400 RepID=UPI0040457EA6